MPLLGAALIIFILIFLFLAFYLNGTNENQDITEDKYVQREVTQEDDVQEDSKIEDNQTVEQPIEYAYNITPEDRETLARLVYLEGNVESLECQKAIASVVINRMYSGYWGNTINSVIYARNQFTPASQIQYTTPTAINYEAVDYVLTNGVTLPTYVLYFRSAYHFSWSGYVPYKVIDSTYFGYMTKDLSMK